MTLQQFIDKYTGKKVGDLTGAYVGECLSLTKRYINELFNITPPPSGVGAAYGYWTNFPHPLGTVFDKVPNTPAEIPLPGDVVIWGKSTSLPYGHIGTIVSADVLSFVSFDQNWPTGQVCKLVKHDYKGVVGFLRPKNTMNCLIANDDAGKKLFEDLVSKSSRYDAFKSMGYETAEAVKILLEDLRRNVEGMRAERDTAKSELEQRRKEHQAFVAKLALNLNTRQDEPEIISKTEMFGRIDGELEDLRVKYSEDRQAFALTEAELNAEISRLKALLAHQNVLENAETKQLLSEIIKRLFRALDFVRNK
jgi:hypothetical protein